MDQQYFHSVTLDKEKCTGCTNCIKHCPTEAIRVRDGKAYIINERCIDCGECIRICPHHAKIAVTDGLEAIQKFKYKIALPPPTLYGQFKNVGDIGRILSCLLLLGFDHVYEVSRAADVVSRYVRRIVEEQKERRPIISSACPAIVRLIQVRFPELLDNIVNINAPMEVAASLAREEWMKKTGCAAEDIGVFFISPCAAKMTSIKSPLGIEKSQVDGVISIMDVYGSISSLLQKPMQAQHAIAAHALAGGVGWANSGGESSEVGVDNHLAVDGVENVIRVLEEIENGKLNDLEFFEGLSCIGGCVGGPLVFENGFVAKTRVRKFVEDLAKKQANKPKTYPHISDEAMIYLNKKIAPNHIMKLDENISAAIRKMDRMEELEKQLPGLDCGACGAPSCKALAEDVVRGFAAEIDCIFVLKERVKNLAIEMVELSKNMDKK